MVKRLKRIKIFSGKCWFKLYFNKSRMHGAISKVITERIIQFYPMLYVCVYVHIYVYINIYICVIAIQLLNCVRLFASPRTAASQASLSFTISQSFLKLKSSELAMPSNHLIFCHPLLLLPSLFPNIRVFSNESALGLH